MRCTALGIVIFCVSLGTVGCPSWIPPDPELLAPAEDAQVDPQNVELAVRYPDLGYTEREFVFFGRSYEPPGEDFTIILLPDTQKYAEQYPETFLAQTQWIVDNREILNIAAVFHLGDLVETASVTQQWEVADAAMSILDAVGDLPYGLAVGNHDQSPNGNPAGTENFNRYFPASRYEGVVPWYGGHFGADNDNHYILFSASGLDFIAIFLEFDPEANAEVLDWADGLLKEHDDRRGIVVTHFTMVGAALDNRFSEQGQATHDALKDNPNLFLILGGHICEAGWRHDMFDANVVFSILADYQCRPNGGDGWLRLLEFSPASDDIHVRTYSPTRDEYLTDPRQQFTLDYVMSGEGPFEEIGRVRLATGEDEARVTWSGLDPATHYEWYVAVNEPGAPTYSQLWNLYSR
jgi:hypothetical protein